MSNKFGGSKHRRYKKNPGVDKREDVPYKEGNRVYAQVKRKLGGSRVEVSCDDGIVRQAIIQGAMYKRVWMNPGDVLLVQVEEMLCGNCSIVYKYNDVQIRKLKADKSLGFKMDNAGGNNNNIVFGEDDEYDSEEEDDIFNKVDKESDTVKKDESGTSAVPSKETKKLQQLKRSGDRIKKQDVDINDVPDEIDFDKL